MLIEYGDGKRRFLTQQIERVLKSVKEVVRPISQPLLFKSALLALRVGSKRRIRKASRICCSAHSAVAIDLRRAIPRHVQWRVLDIGTEAMRHRLDAYYQAHEPMYQMDQGRGKALEHALGLELLDFRKVRTYCDVASARSPIQRTFKEYFPDVELWVQDLCYRDDLQNRRLGGSAQSMTAIPDGYFDALTLHNSFEHFAWSADSDFVKEVDRVLSSKGACLILPIYAGGKHRIYFDPRSVRADLIDSYDRDAELIPVFNFGQEHARFYSPEALNDRIISRVPRTLSATIIECIGGDLIAPKMFPEFALVLHREGSVFLEPHGQYRRTSTSA